MAFERTGERSREPRAGFADAISDVHKLLEFPVAHNLLGGRRDPPRKFEDELARYELYCTETKHALDVAKVFTPALPSPEEQQLLQHHVTSVSRARQLLARAVYVQRVEVDSLSRSACCGRGGPRAFCRAVGHVFTLNRKRSRLRGVAAEVHRAVQGLHDVLQPPSGEVVAGASWYKPPPALVDVLHTLLHTHQHVLLHGSVGTGKSALLCELQQHVKAGQSPLRHLFLDGAIHMHWGHPSGRSLENRLAELAALFGAAPCLDRPALRDHLQAWMESRRVLVLIDDVWPDHAHLFLPGGPIDILSDSYGTSRVVITSRYTSLLPTTKLELTKLDVASGVGPALAESVLASVAFQDERCNALPIDILKAGGGEMLSLCNGHPGAARLAAGLLLTIASKQEANMSPAQLLRSPLGLHTWAAAAHLAATELQPGETDGEGAGADPGKALVLKAWELNVRKAIQGSRGVAVQQLLQVLRMFAGGLPVPSGAVKAAWGLVAGGGSRQMQGLAFTQAIDVLVLAGVLECWTLSCYKQDDVELLSIPLPVAQLLDRDAGCYPVPPLPPELRQPGAPLASPLSDSQQPELMRAMLTLYGSRAPGELGTQLARFTMAATDGGADGWPLRSLGALPASMALPAAALVHCSAYAHLPQPLQGALDALLVNAVRHLCTSQPLHWWLSTVQQHLGRFVRELWAHPASVLPAAALLDLFRVQATFVQPGAPSAGVMRALPYQVSSRGGELGSQARASTLDALGCVVTVTPMQLVQLTRLDALRRLDLRGCEGVDDAGLAQLKGLHGVLRELNVSGCGDVSDAGVSSLTLLPRLKRLDLQGCTNVRDAGLAALGSLAALEYLDVSGCTRLTGRCVEDWAQHAGMRYLRCLGLRDCISLRNSYLPRLRALPLLQCLSLRGCSELTGAVLAVLGGLPKLQYLDHSCNTLAGAQAPRDGMAGLQFLALGKCRNMGVEVLLGVGMLTQLRYLDVSHSTLVTDEVLGRWTALLELRHLDVRACVKLTRQAMWWLRKLERLRYLGLSGSGLEDCRAQALSCGWIPF